MSPSKVSTLTFDKFYNIVDAKQRSASSFHQGINPATGDNLWDVPIANQQDVDEAVAAGKKAFKSWSRVPLEKRKEYLQKYIDLFQTYRDDFLQLMQKETGKPVRLKLPFDIPN